MNYDLDFRYRRALQPDGLRTIATAATAVQDAIHDCRRAGVPHETDPAVLLLARHLGRIASGVDPELTHEADLPLRADCMRRIADLKAKPALIAITRSRIAYDADAKELFHREGKRALRSLANYLGLASNEYDLRSNQAGIAVSSEIILHTETLYIMLSATLVTPGREVLYRRCNGRQDYHGDRNNYCDVALLTDPRKFFAQVRRETGLDLAPKTPQLV